VSGRILGGGVGTAEADGAVSFGICVVAPKEVPKSRWSARVILYGITFFLIFGASAYFLPTLHMNVDSYLLLSFLLLLYSLCRCSACAELGLVSDQLHKYGDTYEHYADKEYKHALGLLLFNSLASLLLTLAHPWLGVGCTSSLLLPHNRLQES